MIESIIIMVMVGGYAAAYPSAVEEVTDYFHRNSSRFEENTSGLNDSERRMARAIVAPEVSTYSSVTNFVELRSMYVTYVYQGGGDFSVGIFQMKPSFAEMVERMAATDKSLSSQYGDWLKVFAEGEGVKAKRRARLKRLEDDTWQMRYLTLFYRLAEKRINNMKFKNDIEKLRWMATLYNSGLTSSPEKVRRMMTRKYFPHSHPAFNYADVAEEFYKIL